MASIENEHYPVYLGALYAGFGGSGFVCSMTGESCLPLLLLPKPPPNPPFIPPPEFIAARRC